MNMMINFIKKFKIWLVGLFIIPIAFAASLDIDKQVIVSDRDAILVSVDSRVTAIDKIKVAGLDLDVKNTDDNTDETFIIASDKKKYSISDGKVSVILGITNLRDDEYGSIKLKYSKGEKIVSASSYSTTVENKIVYNYEDVETPCASRSASSTCYTNKLVSTSSEEVIIDVWTKIPLKVRTDKTSLLSKETIGKYDNNEIRYLFKKGTTFIKIELSAVSTLTFKDEFYVEVFGNSGGYGMLDPMIDNIQNYWKLDGDSDDTPGSNDGTDTSITYSDDNGIINNGAGFNGTNSKIAVGAVTFGTKGTISFWVKGVPTEGSFFFDSTGSRIYFWGGGAEGGWINISFGGANSGYITHSFSVGDFSNLVFTWDGTNGQFYQDGSTLGSSMAFAPTAITTTVLYIGCRNSIEYFLDKPLDEVGIWSRALTSTEVTDLYNSGDGLQYPFTTATRRIINIE